MKTLQVPNEIYKGAGWAVTAIVNERIIGAVYIDHPDTCDVRAAIDELERQPAVNAAQEEDERQYDLAESIEDDEEREKAGYKWSDNYAVEIVGGMMSSTEFNYMLSAKERNKAGIKNKWF